MISLTIKVSFLGNFNLLINFYCTNKVNNFFKNNLYLDFFVKKIVISLIKNFFIATFFNTEKIIVDFIFRNIPFLTNSFFLKNYLFKKNIILIVLTLSLLFILI